MYFKTSLAVNYNRCLLSDILKLIKIGIFVDFLRIRLYITKTDNHWFNIFAHVSKNFQWFIMKSCLLLSYNIVSRLEYPSFFLPSFHLPLPSFFSFLSFIHAFLLRGGLKNHRDIADGFSHAFTFIVQDSETVSYQVTFSVARLAPHTTFFFTF